MTVDAEREIRRANFPSDVHVRAYHDVTAGALVFRATRDGNPPRILEYAITHGSLQHYGEGPMIATALKALREAAENGLPEVPEGQTPRRLTFTND